MNIHLKTMAALASGAVLWCGGAGQTTRAQSIVFGQEYSSTLASTSEPSENITVNWEVSQTDGSYLYLYELVNSPDAVDTVDQFHISFDTTAPGAFISGSQEGGTAEIDQGPQGLLWQFDAVPPNDTSPVLQFQSMLPPIFGNGDAGDSAPPSPWSSLAPGGTPVAVPGAVPEPPVAPLIMMAAILVLPFRSSLRQLLRQS